MELLTDGARSTDRYRPLSHYNSGHGYGSPCPPCGLHIMQTHEPACTTGPSCISVLDQWVPTWFGTTLGPISSRAIFLEPQCHQDSEDLSVVPTHFLRISSAYLNRESSFVQMRSNPQKASIDHPFERILLYQSFLATFLATFPTIHVLGVKVHCLGKGFARLTGSPRQDLDHYTHLSEQPNESECLQDKHDIATLQRRLMRTM